MIAIMLTGSLLQTTRRDREFIEALLDACEQYERASGAAHEAVYAAREGLPE